MNEIFDPSNNRGRCSYIGGSDARTVMGHDEAALIRLWRRSEASIEPKISRPTSSFSSGS